MTIRLPVISISQIMSAVARGKTIVSFLISSAGEFETVSLTGVMYIRQISQKQAEWPPGSADTVLLARL